MSYQDKLKPIVNPAANAVPVASNQSSYVSKLKPVSSAPVSNGEISARPFDQHLADTYKPTFPVKEYGEPLGEVAAKTVGNVPGSAFNFGKGLINFFNPINIAKNAYGAVKGLGEVAVESVKSGKVAQNAKELAGDVAKAGYEAIVPEAARQLIKDDPLKAGKVIEADPFGQIAPFLLIARQAAIKSGKGAQFDAAMSTIAKPGTVPIEAARKTVMQPFEKSYLPENAKAFEEAGITPPVSAMTKSHFVQGAEALAAKSAFGRKILDTVQNAKTAIETKTNEIVERMKPAKTLSDENLGKTIQEGLGEYEDNFKRTEAKIYDDFLNVRENAQLPAVTDRTMRTVSSIIAEGNKDMFGSMDPRIKNLFNALSKEEQAKVLPVDRNINPVLDELRAAQPGKRTFIQDPGGYTTGEVIGESSTFPNWVPERLRLSSLTSRVVKLFEENKSPKPATREAELYDLVRKQAASRNEILPEDMGAIFGDQPAKQTLRGGSLNFENLKETRTSVGEALHKNPTSALKRLYGALSEDMKATVSNKDGALGKELQDINDAYASGKAKIESNIAASITQSNPERIAQNIIKRNSADTLKTVKEMIGPVRFAEIAKAFTRQLFEDSVTRGKFDVDKLKAKLGEYDPETQAEIFTPEQQARIKTAITELEKMKKLTEAMKPGEKFSNGSQTAYNINTGRTLSQALMTPVLLGTGNWLAAALSLFEVGSEYAGTKLFTTKTGRKYMTEGFNPKLPVLPLLQSKMPVLPQKKD